MSLHCAIRLCTIRLFIILIGTITNNRVGMYILQQKKISFFKFYKFLNKKNALLVISTGQCPRSISKN